jgi:Asp-tRNA(Asn)/Glu-tRNA(Gln) amidotransferase A subunit family amidase
MERAREACKELGAEIQEVKLPSPDEVLAVHRVIFCSEAAAYHFEAFPGRLPEYPDVPRRLLELAGTQTGRDYVCAMRQRDEMRSALRAQFERASFLLAPTLPLLTPLKYADRLVIGGSDHDFTLGLIRYTCLFDHTGNPVVSLPVMALDPGIGVSVQVIGPLHGDADTVDFAMQLEAKLDLANNFSLAGSSQ